MKFLILKTKDPYLNLAIEEHLFKKSEDDVFILWQNEPTVVVGKNQNVYTEVNIDYANSHNIHISRRISGGGAVYHDFGNVNYTFISVGKDSSINFKYYTSPILKALSEMGVSATLSGRNDLITLDGRKISGNAEHCEMGRVLHHGTLLFDIDAETMAAVLNVDTEKLKSKGVKSVRSRVASIKRLLCKEMSVDEFIESLASFIIVEYSPEIISPPINHEVELLRQRNSSLEWIYSDREFLTKYDVLYKKRFDFGSVALSLKMNGTVIDSARFEGDFFAKSDIREVEKLFVGKTREDLNLAVENINLSDFIYGMSSEDFTELIKG